MESFTKISKGKLSKYTTFLTRDDLGFALAYERRSDTDRKAPAVIAQPATERDVAILVRYLLVHELLLPIKKFTDQLLSDL